MELYKSDWNARKGECMSLLNPQNGEVFVVRSYKQAEGAVWANNYEIQAQADGVTFQDIRDAAVEIINAERQIHFTWVEFWKHTISTYIPDSQPYNPFSFVSVNTQFAGQRPYPQGGTGLPLTQCVFVRFSSTTGRPGKRFYRGCLDEGDVQFGTRGHVIADPRRTAIANSLAPLTTFLVPNVYVVLASGTPTPTTVRPVTGLSVVQFTSGRKLTNAYFDRA